MAKSDFCFGIGGGTLKLLFCFVMVMMKSEFRGWSGLLPLCSDLPCDPQSVSSAQERLSRAEVRCEHLQQERTLLRESEARLLAEREAAHRERTQTSLLLTNMEAIKNNLERAQSSAAAQLENQVRS